MTFDDGNKVQYTKFYEILDNYGIKGTFYVITNEIGQPDKIGWDGLRELYKGGHEIGSHTHTHPHLTTLSDSELDFELRESQALLSSFNCKTLAYPCGEYDSRVINCAKKYYIAARGYYDTTVGGRDHGYNFGVSHERYALKVFPTEHTFPSQDSPLFDLPLPKFKKTVKQIVENAISKEGWAIFVFHGRHKMTARDVVRIIARKKAAAVKSVIRMCVSPGIAVFAKSVVPDEKDLSKFEWMCGYLANDDRLEVSTVLEIVNRSIELKKACQ